MRKKSVSYVANDKSYDSKFFKKEKTMIKFMYE